jgi:hypothetical protein
MNQLNMFRAIICPSSGASDCGYSNVVYGPNVAVGWRSGVWRRRLYVRCEGCCSVEQHPSHQTHSLRRRTPDPQPTTTLGQYTTLL